MANICEQWPVLPSLGRVPSVQRVRREGGEGEVRSCFLMSLPMLLNFVPGTMLMC